jgi:hypothetical protein
MKLHRRLFLLGSAALSVFARPAQSVPPASEYIGGRGGRIIRVTTLKPEGPGSITEAIKTTGPRVVVFEVGGVVDLNRKSLRIANGDLTIAGQTAPAPGITFIKGGIEIAQGCSNVTIQHVAVRPGEAGQAKKSGWECDGIFAYGAHHVAVENCSITWATDEGLSASGKRFGKDDKGATLEEWRAFTSHDIIFRNNIVAEGLSQSTHSKGEHSKGTLIHDNARRVRVSDSLYAHNMERNVLFKGGVQGEMIGNVVYNPGRRFAHYNLHKGEWDGHPFVDGEMTIFANVFLRGPSTDAKAAPFMLGGEGDLQLTMFNNLARDAAGKPMTMTGRFGSGSPRLTEKSSPNATPMSDADYQSVLNSVLANCGARPWDRDSIDARIVADVRNGAGRIIDSEQEVGGYPVRPETRSPFIEADWNLDTMERLQR